MAYHFILLILCNSSSKRCHLHLREKFLIIFWPDLSTFNKCNKLVSSCHHATETKRFHITNNHYFEHLNFPPQYWCKFFSIQMIVMNILEIPLSNPLKSVRAIMKQAWPDESVAFFYFHMHYVLLYHIEQSDDCFMRETQVQL